jgi:hypothetical protein
VIDDLQSRERQVFDVLATPAGSFEEQYAPVPFLGCQRSTIRQRHRATLRLRACVPSAQPSRFAGRNSERSPLGEASAQPPGGEHVESVSCHGPRSTNRIRWRSATRTIDGSGQIVKPSQSKVALRPGQSVTLEVSVTPKWSSALGQLILPRNDTDQPTVTIKFDHQVVPSAVNAALV